MLHRFRNRFGTAGLVVAIVALVAALAGTAVAASGALTGKQKKEVEKIAKKYAGKPGAPGAAGPTGPAGAAGPKGDAGAAGKDGTNGTNGVSVTTSTASEAECGKASGVKLTSASGNTKVCNGTTGFTKTLPSGQTETGTWAMSFFGELVEPPAAALSFPIPLEEGKNNAVTILTKKETEEEEGIGGCTGTVAQPSAPAGMLCVYTGREVLENVGGELHATLAPEFLSEGYGSSGAILAGFFGEGSESDVVLNGAWAVTAP